MIKELLKEITKEEAKELETGTTYVIYNPLTKIYKEEISGKNDIANNKHAFDQLKYFIKENINEE